MKNYFIEFLNKSKGFQRDKVYFETYEAAVEWGLNNLEKFSSEMIMFNF